MKRSKIQTECLGQTIATALFAKYNHLCILMLNVSFLLQRGGYIGLVTAES